MCSVAAPDVDAYEYEDRTLQNEPNESRTIVSIVQMGKGMRSSDGPGGMTRRMG